MSSVVDHQRGIKKREWRASPYEIHSGGSDDTKKSLVQHLFPSHAFSQTEYYTLNSFHSASIISHSEVCFS